MKPTILRGRATTPDGKLLTLHEHDGTLLIRVDGAELMSTRQHRSEERLAELACAGLRHRAGAQVLVGGLGLGFTLRAALHQLGPDAGVTVVEIMPAVIAWNMDPDLGLGADALADSRVNLVTGDVAKVLRDRRDAFDAVMLDVDNGADALTTRANARLYDASGIDLAHRALRPGGCLAVWSADDDPGFVDRMRRGGFDVAVERAGTHPGGRSCQWLFVGRRTAAPDRGRGGRL